MTEQNKEAIIDIGANLANSAFRDDLEAVLERARQAGVCKILVTGTDLDVSEQSAALASRHADYLFSTAGVHPHDASSYTDETHQALLGLLQQPQVKAVGETGLDFNRNYSPPEQQEKAFERQLQLAIDTGLPLFLHERDAHQRQWEILHYHREQLGRAVIHCFTGNREQAYRYLDLDLYLGITGWICDERRGYHLHDFVGDIPLNRLMIESDAPYLLPRVKPKIKLQSSRRNEPCTLPWVLSAIATHSGRPAAEIARATTDNAIRFFGLSEEAR